MKPKAPGPRPQAPGAITAIVRCVVACVGLVCVAGMPVPRAQGPRPAAAPAPLAFQDVAKAAGLAVQHVNGASPDKFLVETMGSGAVFR